MLSGVGNQVLPDKTLRSRRSTTIVLSVLAVLFVLRVLSQLIQLRWSLPLLPDFAAWQSGAVSYQALLVAQGGLIAFMALSIFAVVKGRRLPNVGAVLCLLGCLYWAVMSFRAIAGFFELSQSSWFDQPLPTAFHFVIATFIGVLGWFWAAPSERRKLWHRMPARISPALTYPLTMLFALCLFSWLVRVGVGQAFSAYLAVTLGATAILIHELLNPYRQAWIPAFRTVGWDVAYLVLVQVFLPAILTLLVVGGLSLLLELLMVDPVGFWPHDWPLIGQFLLMLLSADFLRYWLHRAAHKAKWLWALHAVHHSPKELYSLNVGRFHPGDKALQFLFDALPFALMGVGSDVLALYFVFYAINGFFQHSNANLRLGLLNWIISGPELHRWHHAKAYELANHNFGNNLIIWDALFGTRYLPADSSVGELGIGNNGYPDDLPGQTLAPFVASPDVETRR